jgi:signal recognition particle subunit SRP54
MFESLSEKLRDVFQRLAGKGKLSEKDVDAAMREVRLALLEADVNYKVVKDFVGRVRERAVGAEVMESLTPAQMVVKIVNEELVRTLGGDTKPADRRIATAPKPPTVVMLVGLQGSGKTTMAAKLAARLHKAGQRPLLVAADTRRPAAIQQLIILGQQIDVPVHAEDPKVSPPDICAHAVQRAREQAYSIVLLDTAGRLHIDDELMRELEQVKRKAQPTEVLLVADAMTGQDAVRAADEFNKRVGLTGLILTKVDGDARGGAALSIISVTGVPIKYLGVGEKLDALEEYYPDRLASRILGMGDMLSLIERAESTLDQKKQEEMAQKMLSATFTLEDFLDQLQEVRKMGPLSQIMEMIPGMGGQKLPTEVSEKDLKRVEAIVQSMTPGERREPRLIKGSRKRRIAAGSGTTVQQINQLLNQFEQVQAMMKQMGKMSKKGRRGMLPFFG